MRRIVPFFVLMFLLLNLLSNSIMAASAPTQKTLDNKPDSLQKIHVLSTIKPIQSLVLAIAGNHVESAQLIPENASPHDYSFKPSDISLIKQADVIFRIDENFELLLNQVLKNASKKTPIIPLADNEQIKLLDIIGKHHHAHKAQAKNKASHHNHADNDNKDLHIWTSPQNMQIIASHIAETLSKIDAKNKSFYNNNLTRFKAELLTTSKQIEADLLNVKDKPYVVFHNSWQYFAHQFGLQKPVIIDFHEGISAGIKSIKNIRQKIQKTNIHCLLADPSIKPQRVKTITEGMRVNTGAIDILGANLPLDNHTAVALLKNLSKTMQTCLQ